MSPAFRLTWMKGLCALTVNEYIAYVIFEFSTTLVFGLGFFVDFLLTLVGKYEGVFIQGPKFFSDNIQSVYSKRKSTSFFQSPVGFELYRF